MRPVVRPAAALAVDQHERVRAWLARLAKLFTRGSTEAPGGRPVEELILGGPRRYTWTQLLAETGMDPRVAAQLWRSMGFAELDEHEVGFTDADRDALRRLDQARASDLVPIDIQVAAARPLGQAMAGLADWQLEMLRQLAPADTTQIDDDHIERTLELVLPLLDSMQSYVWHRHLAAAAGRLAAVSPDGSSTRTAVVGFADMVQFTRTTRRLPPAELIELVDRFHDVAADLVTVHHGRVVKTIGDEVLFITEGPADAAEVALGLIEQSVEINSMPELRIGMAHGPVLPRFGDVYGDVVNIASRLTTHAKPGRILIDAHLAEILQHHPGYQVKHRRTLKVRGYSRLESWGLTRAAAQPDAPT